MSPIVTVQYAPRCAACGVLGCTPWALFWLPDDQGVEVAGHWDALCEDCSLALVVAAEQAMDRTTGSP